MKHTTCFNIFVAGICMFGFAIMVLVIVVGVAKVSDSNTVPVYASSRFRMHNTIMRRSRVGKGWLVMAESGAWCVYIPPTYPHPEWKPVTVTPLDTKVEKDK